MRHSRAITNLIGADRDALSPRLKGKLDAHLAACRECAGQAEENERFLSLVSGVAALPEGFDAAVETVRRRTLHTVRTSPPAFRIFGWVAELPRMRPVTVAFGLAALVVLAVLIQPMRRESSSARLLADARPTPSTFRVVRDGSAVKIEWPHNGRSHRIRKGSDPVAVKRADDRVVSGKVWTDRSSAPSPGSVTFYLID